MLASFPSTCIFNVSTWVHGPHPTVYHFEGLLPQMAFSFPHPPAFPTPLDRQLTVMNGIYQLGASGFPGPKLLRFPVLHMPCERWGSWSPPLNFAPLSKPGTGNAHIQGLENVPDRRAA
jgi:hypothetical protein